MKTFIAYWIFIQLILIGVAGTSIYNKIDNKTFKCDSPSSGIKWYGYAFPLVFFVANISHDYCHPDSTPNK